MTMKRTFLSILLLCLLASLCLGQQNTNEPMLGQQVNWGNSLGQGLVGCWLMNEGRGNRIQDLSGNGNTGSLVADTHFVPGKFGGAVDFDGTGDYIQTTFNSTILPKASTVILWIKFDALASYNIMYSCLGGTLESFVESDGSITIYGSARNNPTKAAAGIVAGNWYQIAVVDNTIDCRGYVNAVLKSTGTTARVAGDSLLEIGGRVTTLPINGQIDHFLIYNRALTALEVTQLYLDPFAIFRSEADDPFFWLQEATGSPGSIFHSLIFGGSVLQ